MRKMKSSSYHAPSHIVEGVCLDGDYDELLREAVRVALRIDVDPTNDDWDDLYDRIGQLIGAYIDSPEGKGENPLYLMSRLAACVSDVIPVAIRRACLGLDVTHGKKIFRSGDDSQNVEKANENGAPTSTTSSQSTAGKIERSKKIKRRKNHGSHRLHRRP
jgi:hypothetical protein